MLDTDTSRTCLNMYRTHHMVCPIILSGHVKNTYLLLRNILKHVWGVPLSLSSKSSFSHTSLYFVICLVICLFYWSSIKLILWAKSDLPHRGLLPCILPPWGLKICKLPSYGFGLKCTTNFVNEKCKKTRMSSSSQHWLSTIFNHP